MTYGSALKKEDLLLLVLGKVSVDAEGLDRLTS